MKPENETVSIPQLEVWSLELKPKFAAYLKEHHPYMQELNREQAVEDLVQIVMNLWGQK